MKFPELDNAATPFQVLLARDKTLADQEVQLTAEARRLYGLVQAGIDPNREARVKALAAGKTVEVIDSAETQLKATHVRLADVSEARRVVIRELDTAKREASKAIRDRLKPQHDALLTRLCSSLGEAQSASAEYYALRQSMVDDGINLSGLFDVLPSFLGHPRNKQSECADFFREAARAGYCKVPKEFA